jgi:hypothetical protein
MKGVQVASFCYSQLMAILRSEEVTRKYREHLAEKVCKGECELCLKTSIERFSLWKIVTNDFPYDKVAQTHHMLTPFRHILESQLTEAELDELQNIKKGCINTHYDYLLENTWREQSIPNHFHLHLIVTKNSI